MQDITEQTLSLPEFLKAVAAAGIRRVLLTDYALIEPTPDGGAVVMVPMVRVVATAFDRRPAGIIYRWSEQGESERMVTIYRGTGKGPSPGGRLSARKEEVRQILREEGYEVDDGEWTAENASEYVDRGPGVRLTRRHLPPAAEGIAIGAVAPRKGRTGTSWTTWPTWPSGDSGPETPIPAAHWRHWARMRLSPHGRGARPDGRQ